MAGVKLRPLTCVGVSLAEGVEAGLGLAGPAGGAAGGHRLAQVV